MGEGAERMSCGKPRLHLQSGPSTPQATPTYGRPNKPRIPQRAAGALLQSYGVPVGGTEKVLSSLERPGLYRWPSLSLPARLLPHHVGL